jgi:hypothetical protein
VWGWAKYGRLANPAARYKNELWDRVVDELVELKFRPDLLRGFVRRTGLPGVTVAERVRRPGGTTGLDNRGDIGELGVPTTRASSALGSTGR